MITGSKPEPALVFEGCEVPDQWWVEKFDGDGGCEVQIFYGPRRPRARDRLRQPPETPNRRRKTA
jgi:hypothetical protein